MIILDELDNRILDLIRRQSLHPSEMARRMGMVRTTIQYRLKKIERAGLVTKRPEGKKTVWSAVFPKEHNKSHFKVYEGKDIVQAYKQLLSLPAGATVFAIQGNRAARGEFSALPPTFLKEAHKVFKRRNYILRGITNEKALGAFSDIEESLMQSHVGRTLGIKLFRDEHFLGSGEIMSTKKLLLLANPVTKQVVVIKEVEIVKIVYDLLEVVLEILDGRDSFDLNAYLRSKIAGA